MSKTSKSTTENKPPEWAEPMFKQSASDAMDLYKSGSGGNTYMGSTVAPLSDTTMTGVNQLAQAGQNWDTSGTRGLFAGIGAQAASDPTANQLNRLSKQVDPAMVGSKNIVGQNVGTGMYDQAKQANRQIGSMAEGYFDPIASGQDGITSGQDYRDVYNRAQAPSAASQYLQSYASGDNLKGEGNPFYRERLERDLADTAAQTQSMFSGAGRYGSGANVSTLSDTLAGQRIAALENDWNREQQNQFNAVGMMDAANQAGLGTQLGAIAGLTGIEGQNIANRLAAGGARVGAQSDMAGRMADIGDSIAGIRTGNADRGLNAAVARAAVQSANADRGLAGQTLRGNLLSQAGNFRGANLDRATTAANAMAGLDQRNFQNQLTGAGATLQAGGIMDQQAQAQLADEIAKFYALDNQDWNRLAMLQGAAAGAAGNYGTQNATQRTPINPMGAIGALFSGKGSSDVRLKENIVRIGEANGINLYEFSYAGQPDRWVGVMAQELPLGSPAVIMENDGYLAVDYGMLGFSMERAA